MRRFLLILGTFTAAIAFVGGATASAPDTEHFVYSNHWQGFTSVNGLEACPLFGPGTSGWYDFWDVDLTDRLNVTVTPFPDGLAAHFDSVATLHGVINAPDGRYSVAGSFKEDRDGVHGPYFFSGGGHATISGPGGTVVGRAGFEDVVGWPSGGFELHFGSVTTCHLK